MKNEETTMDNFNELFTGGNGRHGGSETNWTKVRKDLSRERTVYVCYYKDKVRDGDDNACSSMASVLNRLNTANPAKSTPKVWVDWAKQFGITLDASYTPFMLSESEELKNTPASVDPSRGKYVQILRIIPEAEV